MPHIAEAAVSSRAWRVVVYAAYAWAVLNSLYVYLLAHGARVYRVEAATFIYIAALLPLLFTRAAQGTEARPWPPAGRLLVLTAAATLWIVSVGPLVGFPFLSDDYVFLDRYRTASAALHPLSFVRPVFAVLFWLLRTVGGGSTVPFHVVGFVLHVVSAACVYKLTERILKSPDAATIASSIFLLNPLQLEATLWVSGLQEALWTSSLLTAAVVYTAEGVLTTRRIAATAALTAAALLSKETAACFVLIFPLLDLAIGRSTGECLVRTAYIVFGLELAAYLGLRAFVLPSVDQQFVVHPNRYVLKEFVATPYRAYLFPWNPSAVAVPRVITCALGVAALTALLRTARRPALPLVCGPSLILASTLPLGGYFYVGADLVSARYLYFGAAGWSLLLAAVITRLVRRPSWQVTIVSGLAVALFLVLQTNLAPWRTVGEFVRTLDVELRRGVQPRTAIDNWQQQHHVTFQSNEAGIPLSYHGVYVFTNGYAEFVLAPRTE